MAKPIKPVFDTTELNIFIPVASLPARSRPFSVAVLPAFAAASAAQALRRMNFGEGRPRGILTGSTQYALRQKNINAILHSEFFTPSPLRQRLRRRRAATLGFGEIQTGELAVILPRRRVPPSPRLRRTGSGLIS